MRRGISASGCNTASAALLNDLLASKKEMDIVAESEYASKTPFLISLTIRHRDSSEVDTIQSSIQDAMNDLITISNAFSAGSKVNPSIGESMASSIATARNTVDSVTGVYATLSSRLLS